MTDCIPCDPASGGEPPKIVLAGKYVNVSNVDGNCQVLENRPNSLLYNRPDASRPTKWHDGSEEYPFYLPQLQQTMLALSYLIGQDSVGLVEKYAAPDNSLYQLVSRAGKIQFELYGQNVTEFAPGTIPAGDDSCPPEPLGITSCGETLRLVTMPPVDPQPPAGTIMMWAGTEMNIPLSWFLCNGSLINKNDFPELFAAIGYNFGNQDPLFNLPDFRGMFPRGVDKGAGNDPDRASRVAQGTGGNVGDNVGSVQDHAMVDHYHVTYAVREFVGAGGGANPRVKNMTNPESGNPGEDRGQTSAIRTSGSDDPDVSDVPANPSTETRPKNLNINFIISTGGDSTE